MCVKLSLFERRMFYPPDLDFTAIFLYYEAGGHILPKEGI